MRLVRTLMNRLGMAASLPAAFLFASVAAAQVPGLNGNPTPPVNPPLVGGAPPGGGGEAPAAKVDLKTKLSKGQKWSFDGSVQFDNTMRATSNGQLVQEQNQTISHRREGSYEVLEASDGKPTKLRITYSNECKGQIKVNGQAQQIDFPLAGQTITATKQDGQLSHNGKADLAPDALAELGQLFEQNNSMLPGKPIGVGDEWEPDVAEIRQQFQLGPDDKATVKCKFLAIGNVEGRKTADISVTGQLAKNNQGVVSSITLGGVTQVDIETGQILNSDVVGKLTHQGRQQGADPFGQPMIIDVGGGGQMKVTQVSRLLAGGAEVAVGPGPGPGPGPEIGRDPVGPPPGPMGAFAPYVGEFKGDGLTLTFNEFSGATLKGTLAKGNSKFPATAKLGEGKITGTFDAGGHAFNFTATVDGDTMSFDSEGNKYTLKRPAAAPPPQPNPLGGGRNPLGN